MKRLLLSLAASALLASCSASSQPAAAPIPPSLSPSPTPSPIPGVVSVPDLPHFHYLGVHLKYSHTPPLGGDHSPYPLNCAVYTAPVPNENAVHSLEHGAVWLTYQPGVNPAPLAALANIDPNYVLVSPYPGQPAKVTATAWGLQLRVNSTTDPRLREFVEDYHGGAQGGEPGNLCEAVTPAQAQQLFEQGAPAGQPSPPVPADQPTNAAGR